MSRSRIIHRGKLGLLLLLLAPLPAYAYIDPATASTIVQALYYVFYATLAYVVLCYGQFKTFMAAIRQRLSRKPKSEPGAAVPETGRQSDLVCRD